MSKIQFTYNKVYKYIKGKSVIELFFEAIAAGLGTLAVTGITFMIYMLASGQVNNVNIACGICY